mmetsp:Transcript_154800/g.288579  ORF Transcript_154800/g.288579 Transcript_154800/m.288579 type:complete len:101 (+) Transcript_154800:863-1165(+)
MFRRKFLHPVCSRRDPGALFRKNLQAGCRTIKIWTCGGRARVHAEALGPKAWQPDPYSLIVSCSCFEYGDDAACGMALCFLKVKWNQAIHRKNYHLRLAA